MNKNIPDWRNVNSLIFDFDGVFTNNLVYVDEHGNETVACCRSDGLAFDMLRRFSICNQWFPNCFILSKETNPVVSTRAKKLGISCVQSVDNKLEYIKKHLTTVDCSSSTIVYLGNDLNDLPVMMLPCIFSVAPLDAHPAVLNVANLVIPKKGGEGFVRYFIEKLIGVDKMQNQELAKLL